jgi:hypothetical protein
MPTTPEEEADLVKLRAAQKEAKLRCYDYMKHLSRCTEEQLLQSGHRNGVGQALLDTLKSTEKGLKKLIDDHLKKYPD